jgi:cytochrome c556
MNSKNEDVKMVLPVSSIRSVAPYQTVQSRAVIVLNKVISVAEKAFKFLKGLRPVNVAEVKAKLETLREENENLYTTYNKLEHSRVGAWMRGASQRPMLTEMNEVKTRAEALRTEYKKLCSTISGGVALPTWEEIKKRKEKDHEARFSEAESRRNQEIERWNRECQEAQPNHLRDTRYRHR